MADRPMPAPGVRIVKEVYDLPKTRSERIMAIEKILESGGVQRLTMDADEGITVRRAIKRTAEDGPEEDKTDLLEQALSCPMEEFPGVGVDPLMYILRAFVVLKSRGARPLHIIVSNPQTLREWAKIDQMVDVSELFAVPVLVHNDVPDDVLLLVGHAKGDTEVVAFTAKLIMELPTKSVIGGKNETPRSEGSGKRSGRQGNR
jgi:hypothetical protein